MAEQLLKMKSKEAVITTELAGLKDALARKEQVGLKGNSHFKRWIVLSVAPCSQCRSVARWSLRRSPLQIHWRPHRRGSMRQSQTSWLWGTSRSTCQISSALLTQRTTNWSLSRIFCPSQSLFRNKVKIANKRCETIESSRQLVVAEVSPRPSLRVRWWIESVPESDPLVGVGKCRPSFSPIGSEAAGDQNIRPQHQTGRGWRGLLQDHGRRVPAAVSGLGSCLII